MPGSSASALTRLQCLRELNLEALTYSNKPCVGCLTETPLACPLPLCTMHDALWSFHGKRDAWHVDDNTERAPRAGVRDGRRVTSHKLNTLTLTSTAST